MLIAFVMFVLFSWLLVFVLKAGSACVSHNVSGIEGTGNLLEACDGTVDCFMM